MQTLAWDLLHDGFIAGLERFGEQLRVTVQITYLRQQFDEPGNTFVLELSACDRFEYTPYGQACRTDLQEILALEPDLVQAELDGDCLVVWCSGGELRMRYRELQMQLGTGRVVGLEEVEAAARAYWAAWAAKNRP
jgi:hypothetical protein